MPNGNSSHGREPSATRESRRSTCPSCKRRSQFIYTGEQIWPEAVAKRRGVDRVSLWTCAHCGSTIDAENLRFSTHKIHPRA